MSIFPCLATSNVPSHDLIQSHQNNYITHRMRIYTPPTVHQFSTPIHRPLWSRILCQHTHDSRNNQYAPLLRVRRQLHHPCCTWYIRPSTYNTNNSYPTHYHPTPRLCSITSRRHCQLPFQKYDDARP